MDAHSTYMMKQLVDHLASGHSFLCERSLVDVQISDLTSCKEHLLQFLSTFGFFDDMADAEPMAHMMKGLVPRIAPLIYVITGAGPDQVVQCIITCSYKAKDDRNKCHLN